MCRDKWQNFGLSLFSLLVSQPSVLEADSMKLLGYPRALRRSLKSERHSSKVVCEEFVLRSLVASPLIRPRFTPGG